MGISNFDIPFWAYFSARVDNDTGFPSTFFCQMSPYFYQEIVRPLHQKNVPSTKNFLRNEPPDVKPTARIVEHISKEKTATLNHYCHMR